MLYRIKIVKCMDIVCEMNSLEQAIGYARELAREYCVEPKAIYIHVLEHNRGRLNDKGVVYKEAMVD